MTTATVTATCPAASSITQGVERYPIGLNHSAPTVRWYAEIVMPDADVSPCGQYLMDAFTTIIVGDIEAERGMILPGASRDLAMSLATRIAQPLGFEVSKVWPEGGHQDESF